MPWQYQRKDAADSVRFLWGVVGVSNQISVKPALSVTLVKSEIEAAIKRRAATDAQTIAVKVDGSNITLTGTVRSWAERELVTDSAWSTAGVHNVIDKMILTY